MFNEKRRTLTFWDEFFFSPLVKLILFKRRLQIKIKWNEKTVRYESDI